MSAPTAPILDPDHAAFITGAVVIVAAARDAHNVPSVSVALGCRLAPDRRRLTIFVGAARAGSLVADAAANGAIAAVFCEPSSNRTLQVKGTDATVGPPLPGDAALLARQLEAMIPQFALVHRLEEHTRAILDCAGDEVVAITFTPGAAFVQTPGPRAGEALPAGVLRQAGQ